METQVKLLKPCKFNPLKLFLILIILAIPLRARANPIVQPWQNQSLAHEGLLLGPRISFYHTSANFDENSRSLVLPHSASLTQFYFDFNANYALPEDWFVFGRLSVLSSKTTGFSDQLLGVAHHLVTHGFNLSLQFDAVLPASQDPHLGDPSVDLTAGTFAELPLTARWRIEAGAGYTYRTKAYSAAIPYSLMIKRTPTQKGFLFSAGVRGQCSLNTDPTDRATEAAAQLRDADGSAILGAVNPAWTLAQVQFGFRTSEDAALYALVAAPLMGTNTASGLQLSLGMQFHLGTRREALSPSGAAVSEQSQSVLNSSAPQVTGVNDALYLIRINRGANAGIEKGQLFDIIQRDSSIPMGRARVTDVKDDEAVLNMVEFYKDQGIEKGFVVRRAIE